MRKTRLFWIKTHFPLVLLLGALCLPAVWPMSATASAFTAGNILVERVGDGSAANTSSATPVFVDEYLPSTASQSSPLQTINLPNATTRPTSSPFNLMDSGTATSDGQLSRSVNGAFVQLPGYNGISGDANIVNSDGVTISRVIGVLNSSGNIDASRTMNAYTNGNNFRSVISLDGSAFWCAGANGGASTKSLQGIVYYANGTATELASNVNARCINIFNNQLFFSTQSGAAGIYTVGTGLPTSGFQMTNLVIGTGGNPDAFQFNSTTNICYIADDRSSKGGVFKYSYTGGIWVSNYLFGTNVNLSGGCFGLAVDWSGIHPVIYATTGDGKNLIQITDTGSGATPTILATVDGSTKYFHGVAFAPQKATPTITTAPTASAINYGQTLAGSTLSGGAASVAGTFTFTTPSTLPNTGGITNVPVKFTPSDTTNYNTTTTSANVRVNPAPGTISMSTTMNTPANLANNKLILIASDAGVVLSITGVSSTSTNGGTVSLNGADITYTPVASYTGADSFTYTLSDNLGGSSTGTVSVTVNAINASAYFTGSGISVMSGTATLTGSGIPLQTYSIQAASSPSGPWSTIGTAQAGTNGVIQYVDTTFAATNSSGYYRLSQ